ncbi:MAG TPA: hypothetical protein VFW94_16650 [Candidatus Acidoferrales bacterium]|nr:hypothetical protein [Candidatus Acidoferrales bacterium]
MRKNAVLILLTVYAMLLLMIMAPGVRAQQTGTVVFYDNGFPAADTAAPSQNDLSSLIPGARFASADQLHDALADISTHLLVLPYGSAYPEAAWPDIYAYLQRGGNLLVLGGRPFTRAAYRDNSGWHLRAYSVRDILPLLIDQYQETPGSEGYRFQDNPDVVERLPRFSWRHAFSPIIHLTSSDVYSRDGSAGRLDARLDALAWGTQNGRRMSAPAIQIDHVRDKFAGGRWIFLNAGLSPDFYSSDQAKEIIPALAFAARRGAEEFIVSPVLPLYLPGEPVELNIRWKSAEPTESGLSVRITVSSSDQPHASPITQSVKLPSSLPVVIPPPKTRGLFTVTAELFDGSRLRAIYHSGFWIRDLDYLRSGPRLSANPNYFELNGQPLAVVGTTYMASDVQRLYFDHPNVYVWNEDLGQISAAGLNMIRTGWWTGWDKFCDEEGRPYERTLRTMEAFLMTARRHGLPVQFEFFAFLPDVLGGENAYLDPQALRRQTNLISAVVERFHDVPFLAWDLINEPSFSKYTWKMRPNGDPFELTAWNRWLDARYADRAALVSDWNLPLIASGATLPVPTEQEFDQRGMYAGPNSLKLYDFFEFAQDTFADWVRNLRSAIRTTGSQQLITIGQDEGGFDDRLSPAFFGRYVDFTTNHSWWNNDALLWDSLVAKQPGLPMLIQETGLQRELTLDQIARRTPEQYAALLERKVALSFVEGSGAIQWLWNSNDFMTAGNEVPIGALRADATEKPEATVLRDMARFASDIHASLVDPEPADVAIITSQAAQFSAIRELQISAQRNAVRAAAYVAQMPVRVIAANQVANMGHPKLAILPSAQALADSTWDALLAYVKSGGNLLITGPIARDEHWHRVDRAAAIGLDGAKVQPLTIHNAQMVVNGQTIPLSFDFNAQTWLETFDFSGDEQLKQLAVGTGHIFWAPYPVELAEGTAAAAKLYSAVFNDVGVASPFELKSALEPGILIYPTILRDSVLYVMASETDHDCDLDLVDKASHAELKLRLSAGHAAMALIRKSDGSIAARYGF